MALIPADITPVRRPTLPETGLGKGWELPLLAGVVSVLLGFGVVNLYSASAFLAERQSLPDTWYVVRQATGAVVGVIAMVMVALTPYTWWRFAAWPLILLTALGLVVVILPWTLAIAPEINGARRWLNVGITLQPSEFAKLAILIWTAHMGVRKQPRLESFKQGVLPFYLIWGILLLPILLQPDLSTAVVLAGLGLVVLFGAGARIRHFLFSGLLAVPIVLMQLSRGFRAERLKAFGDVEGSALGAGYQVHQSLIALGSGGATGVGFGEGRQKFGFLPEPHNDFIFSMIGEEWGFLGVTFIVTLYLLLILVGFRIARRTPDLFGQLLAMGITSFIAVHVVLHMAVGLGVIPTTGLPLPLISYGRSNLLVTLVALGILFSVGRGDPRALRSGGGGGKVARV